jgi:hypothetical protein
MNRPSQYARLGDQNQQPLGHNVNPVPFSGDQARTRRSMTGDMIVFQATQQAPVTTGSSGVLEIDQSFGGFVPGFEGSGSELLEFEQHAFVDLVAVPPSVLD